MPWGELDDVDFDGRLDPEGAGQDMALRVDGRLGRAYLAVVDELLHQAVVDRHLPQRSVAVEVEP